MSKILTPFERSLKEKMDGYEMPYEQRSWFLLQRKLGAVSAGNYPWIVALVATVMVTAGGSVALYRHRHESSVAHYAANSVRFEKFIAVNSVTGESGALDNSNDLLNTLIEENTLNSGNVIVSNGTTLKGAHSSSNQSANQANTSGELNNSSSSLESGNTTGNQPNSNIPAIKADNVIGFSSSVRKACAGTEIEFQVNNGPKTSDYLWNFGDGHFSIDPTPKHKYDKAGNYDISLSVTSTNGQINTTVMNDMITIQESPDANFIWEFVNEDPKSPSVRIIDESNNANTYEWTFSDGSHSQSPGTVVALKPQGKQIVALNVLNENGCTDGTVKQIAVNTDFKLDAPTEFTAGREVFMPLGLKQSKVNFVLSVYDQSGNKVFETSSRIKGWDGKIPGGTVAEEGSIYNWKVIITNDINKEQKYFNGSVKISP